MEKVAKRLNLKYHETCTGVWLHSAIDVEGHHGTDGRYYLLDLARAFPPQFPLSSMDHPLSKDKKHESGEILYKCFRPEFCRTFKSRLNPDSLSAFNAEIVGKFLMFF
jgi:hypothetical protein